MQLRTKITAIFILLTGLFQIGIFVLIYYFSEEYTENEFYLRLSQRATIAAQAHLDEGEVNVDIYEDIRIRHLQTLPNEREVIYPVDAEKKKPLANFDTNLPESFYQKVFDKEYAEYKKDEYYYTGLLYHDAQGDFIVLLSARDLYGVGKQENLRNILIIAFFVSMIFISILGQYYAKQALSPISEIIKKVNSIRAESLFLRLDNVSGKDELADLTRTFNSMLDRLQISFDLQSNFINNASHELRNPLTAILGQTEIALSKRRTIQEYRSTLNNIDLEASRLDTLVDGMLKLAKTDFDSKGLVIEAIRLDQTAIEIKQNLDVVNPKNSIKLNFDHLPEDERLITMLGSETLLKVALSNILENACKFSDNKKVTLKLLTDDGYIFLIITDEGIGIPSDELKNIFEPFYRGSNVRNLVGFGFGLPLAYRIIKLHSGDIRVSSQVGKGTIVKIKLPTQDKYNSLKS
ncbi:sensor histidine kinase [Kriegella aquimaris]|uniref:histidine kinase n=1 Tax=Kriegella aquimaris TaxID=192904 RepID=A0A1G9TLJ3_9FLAO|nr:HAMP domain-containing sensor histidine kinase [Kriegella aquimaris]SDM48520.1 Signal transduction histidine kinase [Kriegella aquimaris]